MKLRKMLLGCFAAFFTMALLFSVNAFADTEGIYTFTVKNNEATLTKIDYEGMKDIIIPETLGGYPVTGISGYPLRETDGSFNDDDVIESVYIPKTITNIQTGVFALSDIKKLIVDENNPNYSSDEEGALYNKDKSALICLPNTYQDVIFNIPDSVTEIMGHAFNSCLFLQEINIPDSVQKIGTQAFFQAISLEKIVIPEGVEIIDQMCFGRCYSLTKVSLPSTIKTINTSAFTECDTLEEIVIPENVTTIDYNAFSDNPSLKRITFPKSLTTFQTDTFTNTPNLKHIYYEGTEAEWQSIRYNNFGSSPVIHYNFDVSAYKNLEITNGENIISISGSGTTPPGDEGTWHYWDENKDEITTVIIDGNVDNISSYSFSGFGSLENLIIMSDEIDIDANAFSDCPSLENIIIFGNSSFISDSFVSCAPVARVFENKNAVHTFTLPSTQINVIPYTVEDNVLRLSGAIELDSYEFFDTMAAFCLEYDEIDKISFTQLRFENIPLNYIGEDGYTLYPVENNTLTDGEIFIRMIIDGEKREISFNELIEKINEEPNVTFSLVATDKDHPGTAETKVTVVDQIINGFVKALKWAVTLVNKLFSLIKKK